MMATTIIEEIRKLQEETNKLKEELAEINIKIIDEEKIIQIFRNELSRQKCNCKEEFEKIREKIERINSRKNSELDFSDFQPPPNLPWGKRFEENRKDKKKQIKYNED